MRLLDLFIGSLLLSARLLPQTQGQSVRQVIVDPEQKDLIDLLANPEITLYSLQPDFAGGSAVLLSESQQEAAIDKKTEKLTATIIKHANQGTLTKEILAQTLAGKINHDKEYLIIAARLARDSANNFPLEKTLILLFDEYHAKYGAPQIGQIDAPNILFDLKTSIKSVYQNVYLPFAKNRSSSNALLNTNYFYMQIQAMGYQVLMQHYASQHEIALNQYQISAFVTPSKENEMLNTQGIFDMLLDEANSFATWVKLATSPRTRTVLEAMRQSFEKHVKMNDPKTTPNLQQLKLIGNIDEDPLDQSPAVPEFINMQNAAVAGIVSVAANFGFNYAKNWLRAQKLRDKVRKAQAAATAGEMKKSLQQQKRDQRLQHRQAERNAAAAASDAGMIHKESLDEKRNTVFNKAFHDIIKDLRKDNNVDNLYRSKAPKTKDNRNKIQTDAKENIDDYFAENSDVINGNALRAFIIERLNQLLPVGKRIGEARALSPVVQPAVIAEPAPVVVPEPVVAPAPAPEKHPAKGKGKAAVAGPPAAQGAGPSTSRIHYNFDSDTKNKIQALFNTIKTICAANKNPSVVDDFIRCMALKNDLIQLCEALHAIEKTTSHVVNKLVNCEQMKFLRHGLVHEDLDAPIADKLETYQAVMLSLLPLVDLPDSKALDQIRTREVISLDMQLPLLGTFRTANKVYQKTNQARSRVMNDQTNQMIKERCQNVITLYSSYINAPSEPLRKALIMCIVEIGEINQQLKNAHETIPNFQNFAKPCIDIRNAFSHFEMPDDNKIAEMVSRISASYEAPDAGAAHHVLFLGLDEGPPLSVVRRCARSFA